MWELVGKNTIKNSYGKSLVATSKNETAIYYRQFLIDQSKRNNYTVITKINEEYEIEWEVVYKTALDLPEKIAIDENLGFLYTLLNIGDSQNNHEIILKLNITNGTFVNSTRLRKDKQYKLGNLQYNPNDKNISFLMTNDTLRSYQV